MPITGTIYGKFCQLLLSKTMLQLSIKFLNSLLICSIVFFTTFKHANIKMWGWQQALWSNNSRRLRTSRDITIGGWWVMTHASSAIFTIYINNTTIHRGKLKMSCYNHYSDWCVGFCCNNALGIVQTVHPIPQPNVLRIALCVWYMPSCIVTTNPSRTGLNLL